MKRFVVVLTVWAMGLAGILISVVLPAGTAAAATLGVVTNITARPHIDSITLSWTPGSASSLTGVEIRRALGRTAPSTATGGTLVTHTAKRVTSFTDRGLKPGTQYSYALFAHDAKANYAAAATVTSTTTGTTKAAAAGRATAGAVAAAVGTASISGRVTDAGASPSPLVNVDVYVSSTTSEFRTITDAEGNYTVTELAADDYEVCFTPNEVTGGESDAVGYLSQCFDKIADPGVSTPVPVIEGESVSGIDAALAAGGAVTGRVSEAGASNGLSDVEVSVASVTTGLSNTAVTDIDGNYTVIGLEAGSDYLVCFTASNAAGGTLDHLGYVDECYDNAGDLDEPILVEVTLGETLPGIDAELAGGAAVSGTVTAAVGSPNLLEGVQVVVSSDAGGSGTGTTDVDGTYTVAGLTTGDYKVCFSDDGAATGGAWDELGYVEQCFDNQETSGTPTLVSLTVRSNKPGINAALAVNTPRPLEPTDVLATPGDNQAQVSWVAPLDNGGSAITGYTVTASPGGATAITEGDITSATVTGLTNGIAYTFTVTATNPGGTGPASPISTEVTPFGSPVAPTEVLATKGNALAVVSWTAPVNDGGSAITEYTVIAFPGGATAITEGDITSATVTGLTNGTAYTFTVTATSLNGTSGASAPSAAVTPMTSPGAPTAVSATKGNASAVVSWTAPVNNGGSAITRYTVTSSPGAKTATTTGDVTSAEVTGLTNGTAYTFTVTATTLAGPSAASAASSAVTPVGSPGAPIAVSATKGNASAVVSWTAPVNDGGSGITGYTVTASPAGATATTTGATSATVTGLTNGTAYTFTVTATSSIGTSGASAASLPVTPTAPVILPPVQRYINKVYLDLFDRTPDSTGLATWTSALNGGTPRVAVANGITYSDEYRSKLITGSYQRFLSRAPDQGGLTNWLAAMGGGLTISQMESGFIASDEYWNKADATPQGWVNRLYADVLGRPASTDEVAGWTTNLANGMRRDQVAMGFLLSTERLRTVVDGHYQQLLGRGIDPTGQGTWVGILQRGGRDEAIIGGIIASEEYYGRV